MPLLSISRDMATVKFQAKHACDTHAVRRADPHLRRAAEDSWATALRFLYLLLRASASHTCSKCRWFEASSVELQIHQSYRQAVATRKFRQSLVLLEKLEEAHLAPASEAIAAGDVRRELDALLHLLQYDMLMQSGVWLTAELNQHVPPSSQS